MFVHTGVSLLLSGVWVCGGEPRYRILDTQALPGRRFGGGVGHSEGTLCLQPKGWQCRNVGAQECALVWLHLLLGEGSRIGGDLSVTGETLVDLRPPDPSCLVISFVPPEFESRKITSEKSQGTR